MIYIIYTTIIGSKLSWAHAVLLLRGSESGPYWNTSAALVPDIVCAVYWYCGVYNFHIRRKMKAGFRYEPVYQPAIVYI